MLGDCAADISDQMRRCCNYQRPVAVGAVAACRQAVAIRCERGISGTVGSTANCRASLHLSLRFQLYMYVYMRIHITSRQAWTWEVFSLLCMHVCNTFGSQLGVIQMDGAYASWPGLWQGPPLMTSTSNNMHNTMNNALWTNGSIALLSEKWRDSG